MNPTNPIIVPNWVRDAVFYQIFPDRFAMSNEVNKPTNLEPWSHPSTINGFKGGDLIGILDNLDYLEDLGITAIYLNPIFSSTANHRYHTHDYFVVDPILGSETAFRRLLDAAHDRDIRIVLDGVFNHASRGFYQFNHTLENGRSSPYIDWFHFNQEWINSGRSIEAYQHEKDPIKVPSVDAYGYHAWWNIPSLPKFNTQNPAVKHFILKVAEYWIKYGIDGWRLDVPQEINDDEFWRAFRKRVKKHNREAYIVGEIWEYATHWLNRGDMFDAVMNYPFSRATIGFLFHENLNRDALKDTGISDVVALNESEYAVKIQHLLSLYPEEVKHAQLNLLSSHDTARIITIANGDIDGVKLAFLLLYTFPGAPCLYYGDEIGMAGGRDPDSRRAFNWTSHEWNYGMRNFIKACIQLRKKHRALRRGNYEVIKADNGIYCFQRSYQGEIIIVCINATREEKNFFVKLKFHHNYIEGFYNPWQQVFLPLSQDMVYNINLHPREGQIFISRNKIS